MFPASTRDIALISGAGVTHEQLVQVMKKAGPAELTGITLFDIFKDKKLNGRTSLAYSLEFRSPERTLKDEEVNAALDKIKSALKAKLQVEIPCDRCLETVVEDPVPIFCSIKER